MKEELLMGGYIDEYIVPRITLMRVSGLKEDISLEPILAEFLQTQFF